MILKKFLKAVIPDFLYLKYKYRKCMKKSLNLKNPQSFNEKIQWLKLYDRNPEYTKMVDKYEVKKYVADIIGEEYIIPTLGVWDCFDDIDFDLLPNQFVLKCTHDSGGVVICTDKSKLNIEEAKKKISNSLKMNYYLISREWIYKNVKPRIIAEKLIETDCGCLPNDYKINCFNGKPDSIMVCIERSSEKPKFYFFDRNWNMLKHNYFGLNATNDFTLEKPSNLQKLLYISEVLSKDLPFVRIDLYNEKGKVYFGEMTFYPQSGFDMGLLETSDILFGKKLNIKELKR